VNPKIILSAETKKAFPGCPEGPHASDVIRHILLRGGSNADIMAALPRHKPHSLRSCAAQLRGELGIAPVPQGNRLPLQLPLAVYAPLQRAADARSTGQQMITANDMALRILALVVRDDMIDAVLDDGVMA
jgi:hypothetical protein